MTRFSLILSSHWIVVFASLLATPSSAQELPLTRIAFGSCVRQDRPQPIWRAIIAHEPELFLMIGDNIYGDSEDPEILKLKYNLLGADPGFAKLRSQCPVLATWDDHDYGVNDGGREYPSREASQRLFNDFFGVPLDSPRRQRPGIYDSAYYGPAGQRVQILLLDTRYFRSNLKTVPADQRQGRGPYGPNTDEGATLLGEDQWQWLEQELRRPAEVRIIATSIQFAATEHGWEAWSTFPNERQRLFELIHKTEARGVVLISGDRHLAELSKVEVAESGLTYPLYDLTSSSLNQPSGGGNENEINSHRIGDHFLQVNFGSIEIQWPSAGDAESAIRVALRIHGIDGQVVREQRLEREVFESK